MTEILALMMSHPNKGVRKMACSIFSSANQNNDKVQKFCTKLGALNLTHQIESEADVQVKEALFMSLSNLIKADHFEGKRLFIRDFDGLAFLNRLCIGDYSSRFQRKLLSLLNDLCTYDDFIFGQEPNGDKFFVRRFFTHRDDLI